MTDLEKFMRISDSILKVWEIGADLLREQKETNRLLQTLILKTNTVHVSAISESEFHARKWDVDSATIEEVQANLPPKQSHDEFVKRMEEGLKNEEPQTFEKWEENNYSNL
jgi:hypothetical protein